MPGRSFSRPRCRCAPATTKSRLLRACCARSTSSIRAPCAGFSTAPCACATGASKWKGDMRSWCIALTSALGLAGAWALAAPALALPPAKIEIAFEMTRNGSAMAETVEQLQHAGGRYELVETLTGKGGFFWMGSIKRTSRGEISARGSRPLEFSDERTGRPAARAWFDWDAKILSMEYREP